MNILNNINSLLADAVYEKPINTQHDSFSDIINLFENQYSQAFQLAVQNKFTMFRGNRNVGLYVEREPSLRFSSSGIPNIYTRLLSGILPSWRKYPHRNKSFICSLATWVVSSYTHGDDKGSGVYWVLPENNAKIGVCPTRDIWSSFENSLIPVFKTLGISSFSSFSRFMFHYILILFIFFKEIEIPSESNLSDVFNKGDDYDVTEVFNKADRLGKFLFRDKNLTEEIKEERVTANEYLWRILSPTEFFKLLDIFGFLGESMLSFLDKILNPDKNNFQLFNLNAFKMKENSDRSNEVWTDAKSLFIDVNNFQKFLLDMEENEVIENYKKFGETFKSLYGKFGDIDVYNKFLR